MQKIFNEREVKAAIERNMQRLITDIVKSGKEGRPAEIAAGLFASVEVAHIVGKEVADATTHNLHALLAEFAALKSRVAVLDGKAAAPAAKCAPVSWNFTILRDEFGEMVSIHAEPEIAQ